MSFFGFLLKRKFYLNLALAIALTIVLFFIVLQFLKVYTNHGDTYVLPDFQGKTLDELALNNYDQLYEFIIIDSIFDLKNPKGSVVIQNPPAGSKVKEHRKVYLTLVAYSTEKVEMPDLIDLSLRQAVNSLRSKGLKVNNLQYVQDFAGNAVLEQLFKDEVIDPGTIIDRGSSIDLVVGLGQNDYATIPLLIGLNLKDAIDAIHKASFNRGNISFLDGEDLEHARVYRQEPVWMQDSQVFKGKKIDISLRSDLSFDFEELRRQIIADTLNNPDTTNLVQPEF